MTEAFQELQTVNILVIFVLGGEMVPERKVMIIYLRRYIKPKKKSDV